MSSSVISAIQHRQIFRHKGRAHRIALVPLCPTQFYSGGEDGVCCLFDIRTLNKATGLSPGEDVELSDRRSVTSLNLSISNYKSFDLNSDAKFTVQDENIDSSPEDFQSCLALKTKFTSPNYRSSSIYCLSVNQCRPHEIAMGGTSPSISIYDTR